METTLTSTVIEDYILVARRSARTVGMPHNRGSTLVGFEHLVAIADLLEERDDLKEALGRCVEENGILKKELDSYRGAHAATKLNR